MPAVPTQTLTMWQPADLERPARLVSGLEELAAGKLCALMDRALPRDLFDVSRLPELMGSVWNTPRIRKLFVAFAGMLNHPIYSYRKDRFARASDRVVERELWPMLNETETCAGHDLRERTWTIVGPLLDLDDDEREYTERIQRGELRSELLFFDDHELVDRLSRHPALLWKAENARRYRSRMAPCT